MLGSSQRPLWAHVRKGRKSATSEEKEFGPWHAAFCKVAGPWSRAEANGGASALCSPARGCRICDLIRSNMQNAAAAGQNSPAVQAAFARGVRATEGVAVTALAKLMEGVKPHLIEEDFYALILDLGPEDGQLAKLIFRATGQSMANTPVAKATRRHMWRDAFESARHTRAMRIEARSQRREEAREELKAIVAEAQKNGTLEELDDLVRDAIEDNGHCCDYCDRYPCDCGD